MKYKITISEVNEQEVKKTEEVIVHKKTGEVISWSKWYEMKDEDKKAEYARKREFTGEVEVESKEKTIYEQEINDLDIGELAIYINRAK